MHIFRPVTAEGIPMFVVRCDFKNGVHREYGYTDLAIATDTFRIIDQARQKSTTAGIFDEGGRQAAMDCRELLLVELVDIQKETLNAIVLLREVQDVQRKAGLFVPAAPQAPQQEMLPGEHRDDAPEYRGAIGRGGGFAS
jgi:hypothetical protein